LPHVFLSTPAKEREPVFSPDGRWVAYTSDESGRNEVYVRAFPGAGAKAQISNGGGVTPVWSRVRPELLYATLDQRLMATSFQTDGGVFRSSKPHLWSERRYAVRTRPGSMRSFDLHKDGQRFALAAIDIPDAQQKRDHVTMILNFSDELRRIAPVQHR
jgi:serine/threonine-protein kinase